MMVISKMNLLQDLLQNKVKKHHILNLLVEILHKHIQIIIRMLEEKVN